MIKFVCTVEDQEYTFESIGDGKYKLTAKDNFEGTEGEKVVDQKDVAAILFSSFDEFENFASLEDVSIVANEALQGFPVAILP